MKKLNCQQCHKLSKKNSLNQLNPDFYTRKIKKGSAGNPFADRRFEYRSFLLF
jgi:hypothetical protein